MICGRLVSGRNMIVKIRTPALLILWVLKTVINYFASFFLVSEVQKGFWSRFWGVSLRLHFLTSCPVRQRSTQTVAKRRRDEQISSAIFNFWSDISRWNFKIWKSKIENGQWKLQNFQLQTKYFVTLPPKKHNLESMLELNCYSQHQAFRRNCDQIFWSKCKISSWKWGDHLINNLHFYLLSNNVVCHQIWFDLKDAFEICTLFVKEPFIPYLEVYLDLWRLFRVLSNKGILVKSLPNCCRIVANKEGVLPGNRTFFARIISGNLDPGAHAESGG